MFKKGPLKMAKQICDLQPYVGADAPLQEFC
jgi:hypothetical protein